jgi:fermentation-respiration switch protein FrsA (DUF1100 family)
MSKRNYDACGATKKKLVTIENAGHGLAFPVNREKYIESLRDFEIECDFFNK